MLRGMVKDHKTYQGVPGFLGGIKATPKGGIRLVFSVCDDVMNIV